MNYWTLLITILFFCSLLLVRPFLAQVSPTTTTTTPTTFIHKNNNFHDEQQESNVIHDDAKVQPLSFLKRTSINDSSSSSHTWTNNNTNNDHQQQEEEEDYLVMFHQYYQSSIHFHILYQIVTDHYYYSAPHDVVKNDDDDDDLLSLQKTWIESCVSVIQRDNTATRMFPSDFVLLHFSNETLMMSTQQSSSLSSTSTSSLLTHRAMRDCNQVKQWFLSALRLDEQQKKKNGRIKRVVPNRKLIQRVLLNQSQNQQCTNIQSSNIVKSNTSQSSLIHQNNKKNKENKKNKKHVGRVTTNWDAVGQRKLSQDGPATRQENVLDTNKNANNNINNNNNNHNNEEEEETNDEMNGGDQVDDKRRRSSSDNVPSLTTPRDLKSALSANEIFDAQKLWDEGVTGADVHVAVFDTGLCPNSHGFKHIEEQINYTYEETPYDSHGHGTFVASVIAGSCQDENKCCTKMKGLAPDAHLHIFKVFTHEQVSYTSWFLDAFNYALQKRIDILNLSIGGPDYMDVPFVDKIRELAAHNIIVVSAIGNDGPLYGTLNNPADLSSVLGIGAVDHVSMRIAPFSSRGTTLYELSLGGYGRMKPDLVTFGVRVLGHSCPDGIETKENGQDVNRCQKLSGTSVASPVATGVVALLLSASYKLSQSSEGTPKTISELQRESFINPASIKQILVQSAQRVPHHNMFEQGAGKIDLLRAYKLLQQEFKAHYADKHRDVQLDKNAKDREGVVIVDDDWPRASLLPSSLDFTETTYAWPFSAQPLYYSQIPVIVNITILNGMSQFGEIIDPPEFVPDDETSQLLDIKFTYSKRMSVWTGYLALHITVKEPGRFYSGIVSGKAKLTVRARLLGTDLDIVRQQTIFLPIKANIIPTPMRSSRILWDQYHQLIYPTASYVPKDDLSEFVEPEMNHNVVDWNGDHPHTNFVRVFNTLIRKGYYIEVLNSGDWTTFDARNYGTLLIVDIEDEIMESEALKLENDVRKLGLNVVIFADWYNEHVIGRLKFLDDNTQSIWIPITGGSNIPALNGFLHRFGIMLGDTIFTGPFFLPSSPSLSSTMMSGSSITRFPRNGELLFANVSNETPKLLSRDREHRKLPMRVYTVPILGLYQVPQQKGPSAQSKSGKIVVFGDSNCIDTVSKLPQNQMCIWLLEDILSYTNLGKRAAWMDQDLVQLSQQDYIYSLAGEKTMGGYTKPVPERITNSPLPKYSRQPLLSSSSPIATFDVKNWPNDSSPFYIDVWATDSLDAHSFGRTSRSRILFPVSVVFVLMFILMYMSLSKRRYMIRQHVRPHTV